MSLTYPLIMLGALATAVTVGRWTRRPLGLSGRERAAVGLGAFCGGMIGAKLPFVLIDPEGLASGAAWLADGKSIMFGLPGGYLGVEIAKWATGIRAKTGDGFAAPVAAGIAVGRWACFAAGCCAGRPSSLPWAVDFGDGVARQPTQIYESAFHAGAACALFALQRRGLFRRQLIKVYILSYLAYRFATEFIRPEPRLALGLTLYQWTALALAPVFMVLYSMDRERRVAGTPPAD